MTQYINKADIVAEINRVLDSYDPNEITSGRYALIDLRNFLETLEVKEVDLKKEIEYIRNDFIEAKEVDFEEELISLIEKEKAFVTDNREIKYYNGDSFNHIYELEFIAKHFFELGLKMKGGEE